MDLTMPIYGAYTSRWFQSFLAKRRVNVNVLLAGGDAIPAILPQDEPGQHDLPARPLAHRGRDAFSSAGKNISLT